MKQILGLLVLVVGLSAVAEESVKVKVTGGRVNIRSRPSMSGELMGQVMLNDELTLTGKTNGDFVAVFAPDWVECWVAKEYVQGGIVVPPKLNVRAGPTMNYGVVAVAVRGDKLDVIKEQSDWVQVKAPSNSVAWISASFIGPIGGVKPEPVIAESVVEASPVETNVVAGVKSEVKPETKESVPDMASAYEAMLVEREPKIAAQPVEPKLGPPVPIVLELDPKKTQGEHASLAGTLQPSRSIKLYRLVGVDGRTKCFVSGKIEQMREWVGSTLKIEGTEYFYKRLDFPVVRPRTLIVPEK